MTTTKKEKGSRLSLYEKVYRELDATMIGAERQRNVPDNGEKRYDMYDEIRVDYDDNYDYVVIHSADRARLNFAERVAQHYGAPYFFKEELWRIYDPSRRYEIWINVTEQ